MQYAPFSRPPRWVHRTAGMASREEGAHLPHMAGQQLQTGPAGPHLESMLLQASLLCRSPASPPGPLR